MQHYNLQIFGKVQGVFFREEAKKLAKKLKLKGYAKNGAASVIIEVEGPEDKLKEFIEWCHEGSGSAKVERVEVTYGQDKNFEDFEIK